MWFIIVLIIIVITLSSSGKNNIKHIDNSDHYQHYTKLQTQEIKENIKMYAEKNEYPYHIDDSKMVLMEFGAHDNTLTIKNFINNYSLNFQLIVPSLSKNYPGMYLVPGRNEKYIHISKKYQRLNTGNEQFDKQVIMYCDNESYFIPLFNKKLRSCILRLLSFSRDLYIKEKEISYSISRKNLRSGGLLLRMVLDYMNNFATIFSKVYKPEELMKRNIRSDPSPGFRKKNLELLIKNYKQDKRIKDFLKNMVLDDDFEIALISCKAIGNEGNEILLAFLRSESPQKYLIKEVNALKVLASTGDPVALQFIIDYHKQQFRPLKLEIIKALALSKNSYAGDFLLSQLHTQDKEMKIEVIKSLKECADLEAVNTLYNLIKTPFINGQVKKQALKAIQAIQTRHGSKEKGMLSLSEDTVENGALSIVKNQE